MKYPRSAWSCRPESKFQRVLAVVAGAALVLSYGVMMSIRGIGTLRGEEWFMPREFVAVGPF